MINVRATLLALATMFSNDSTAGVIEDKVLGFSVSVPDGTVVPHQKDEDYRSIHANFTDGDGDTIVVFAMGWRHTEDAQFRTPEEVANKLLYGTADLTKYYPIAAPVKQSYRGREMYVATYPANPSDRKLLTSAAVFVDHKSYWQRNIVVTVRHARGSTLTHEQLLRKLDELKLIF